MRGTGAEDRRSGLRKKNGEVGVEGVGGVRGRGSERRLVKDKRDGFGVDSESVALSLRGVDQNGMDDLRGEFASRRDLDHCW